MPKPHSDAVSALLDEVAHQEQPQPVGAKADLKGRGAIVTGAATGIGRAVALEFARRGCGVAFNYTFHSFWLTVKAHLQPGNYTRLF